MPGRDLGYRARALTSLEEELEAVRRDPASQDAVGALRRRATELGDFRGLAEGLRLRGEALIGLDRLEPAVDSLVESALVSEEKLEDLEAAARAYQRVLAARPDHKRALFSLGLLFHDLNRWTELVELYRQRQRDSRDDGERTTLHLYVAEILSERLLDDRAAFDEILKAARLSPRNIRIISRLQDLGDRTSRVDEVAVVIGDLIMHQDDPRVRAALSLRLAELHLGPLKDDQRALAYLRAALADDGGNPEILSEIEDVFRERQRFDELAKVLEESAADRRIGPHRVRLERELARIYESELDDVPRAMAALNRALRHSPEDRELLDEVMRLGLVSGDLAAVAETYERVSRETDNTLLKTYLRLKLGHLYANVLERESEAIRVYWAILDDEPLHKEARRRLHRIHEKAEDHRKIVRLLEMDAEELEGMPESVPILLRLAKLRRDSLDEPRLAVEAYRRILAVVPDHPEAKAQVGDDLERDLEQVGVSAVATGNHEAPTDFVGHGFGPESETNWAPPSPEMLAELALGEGAPSVETRPEPVVPDPSEAHSDVVAAEAPEDQTLAIGPDDSDMILIESPVSVPNLEALPLPPPPPPVSDAVSAEAPTDPLSRLEQELEEASQKADRPRMLELLVALVKLHEEQGDRERAFFTQVRLVELDPTTDRLDATLRLGREAQGYPLLISTIEKLVAPLPKDQQRRYGLQLASVELEELRDVSAALARFARLDQQLGHDEAVFGRWMSVLDQAGRYDDMAIALGGRLDRLPTPTDAASFVIRAATLVETKLADPVRAAAILVELVRRAPDQEDARLRAEDLFERYGLWAELVGFLGSQLDRLEGDERAAMRERIARILLDQLDDLEAAEQMLRAGLEERSRDPALIEALEDLYERHHRWREYVDMALRRVEVLKSLSARTPLQLRIATIAEEELEDPELALDVLAAASAEAPRDLEVLSRIEKLRRARGDWPGVLEILEKKAGIETDPEARALVLVAIAELRAEALDLGGAILALEQALAEAPEHRAALLLLAEMEERRGGHASAIAALRRLAELSRGAERAAALVRIGGLLEAHGAGADAARSEYELAYEADPGCLAAILALLDIAEREEDFVRAHDLAAHAASLTEADREQAELWRRAGRLAQEQLGDDRRALEHYERALHHEPEDPETEAKVGLLLLARELYAEAYPHLEAAAVGLTDPERAAQLYLESARAAEQIGHADRAASAYEQVLLRRPTDRVGLDRLGVLLVAEGAWDRVYQLGANLILHHEARLAPRERAPVYLRMAQAKRAMGDVEAAARLAKRSNQLEDGNPETLALLAEVLAESGDPFEAAECLKRLSVRAVDGVEKRNFLFRAGRLLGDQGQDPARACAMLAEAQSYAPGDLEVADWLSRYREETGDPAAAADALVTAARMSTGRVRADLLVRASRILTGAHRERGRAKKHLVEALEIAPAHEAALGDAAVMLEFDGDLAELAHLLERAATTLLEDPAAAADAAYPRERAMALFGQAIDLYRFRLNAIDRALGPSRRLRELAPKDGLHREEHARLLTQATELTPRDSLIKEAIFAWSEIVEDRPGDLEALAQLRSLRAKAGEGELARVTGELIEAWGGALPPLPAHNGHAPSPLTTQMINTLQPIDIPLSPEEQSVLEPFFTTLGLNLVKALQEALPEPRPKKRDLVGAAGLGIHVTRPLGFAVRVLGMEPPPVYVRDEAPAAIQPTLVDQQAALVVSLPKAQQHSPEQLRFLMGRSLSLLRPRALALAIIPLEVLKEALVGFAKLDEAEKHFVDPKQAKRRGKLLDKQVPPAERARLVELVARWLDDPNRRSLAVERDAVLRTAERAGMVASASIAVTLDTLRQLAGGADERHVQLPLLKFAATRHFAEMVRRLS